MQDASRRGEASCEQGLRGLAVGIIALSHAADAFLQPQFMLGFIQRYFTAQWMGPHKNWRCDYWYSAEAVNAGAYRYDVAACLFLGSSLVIWCCSLIRLPAPSVGAHKHVEADSSSEHAADLGTAEKGEVEEGESFIVKRK